MSSTLVVDSDQLRNLCSVRSRIYSIETPSDELTDAQESFVRLFRALIAKPYSSSRVSTEAQTFVNEALPPYVVVLILAGITVLAWLPLWISRCCAHRCCPPSEAGPSRRWRRGCTVCYWIMYILLFICAFMGTLACIDLIRSLERVTCDSVTQLNTLGQSFALVGTNVSAYSSQRSADANTQLDQGLDGLACARDALVNLCARVEEQHSAALALDARLDNATDAWDSALGLSAQEQHQLNDTVRCSSLHWSVPALWSLPIQYMTLARERLRMSQMAATACDEVLGALPSTFDGLSDLTAKVLDALRTYWSAIDTIGQLCLDLALTINDINVDILSFSDDLIPTLQSVLTIAAVFYFAGPMLLNTVAACFVGAWVKRRETPARCNAWAVQCVGCAWVFASLTAFIYLMTALVILILGQTGYQLAGTIYISGTDFSGIFNNTYLCGGAIPSQLKFPVDLNDPGEACAVFGTALEACNEGNNYVEELFKLTGLNTSLTAARDELVDLARRFDDSEPLLSESAVVSEVNATLAGFRQLVSETTSSQFGGNQSHADELAALTAAAAASASAAAEASDCVTAAQQAIILTRGGVSAFLILLIFVLSLLLELGNCQFTVGTWTVVAEGFYSISTAPLILGIVGLILAGIFSVLYIPPTISMQVLYGGVGLEPGCPRRCRCCCPPAKRKSAPERPAATSGTATSATHVAEPNALGESPPQSHAARLNAKVAAAARNMFRRPVWQQTQPADSELAVPISPAGARRSGQSAENPLAV